MMRTVWPYSTWNLSQNRTDVCAPEVARAPGGLDGLEGPPRKPSEPAASEGAEVAPGADVRITCGLTSHELPADELGAPAIGRRGWEGERSGPPSDPKQRKSIHHTTYLLKSPTTAPVAALQAPCARSL